MMPDNKSLLYVIEKYKESFKQIREEENYKWKAVKCFQDHWDINAADFKQMIDKSLSMSANLLASVNFFPKGMISGFAEKDPEFVRKMFLDLFDESTGIADRINNFIAAAEVVRSRYDEGTWANHYQNYNSVSVYLFFRYPEKYYIYKSRKFRNFAAQVGYSDVPKQGRIEGVASYFDMCDKVREIVVQDTELLAMSRESLTEDCYGDEAYHVLTEDVVFFGSRLDLLKEEWWPDEDEYSPGITTEAWLGLIRDEAVFTRDSLAIMKRFIDIGGEATCTQLSKKYGEVKNFYNAGSSALARRVWQKTQCPLLGDGKDSKWWPVLYTGKHADKDTLGSFVWRLRPELKAALEQADLSAIPLHAPGQGAEPLGQPAERQYWWLNVNPKIWSLASTRVGEVENYTLLNESGNKRRIYQNFLDAKADDYVIGYESTPVRQIVALCKISQENDGEQIHFEKVENLPNPIDYSLIRDIPELADMEYLKNPQGSLFKLTAEEYTVILDVIREQNPVDKGSTAAPYTKADFLNEVYLDEAEYERLKSLLKNKKNVILQGAPGVGKTFAAKRLAYSILGSKDEDKIEFVQFHQNYAYEDFIMGYKPQGGTFEMKYGVFYRFCQKAENNPDDKYFFIIDEINRGDLSKIFGELLMLIENEYRGTQITLAYNGLPFSIPENLYIIGLMNTADRSLAMIDYALRRRFSFYTMTPAFGRAGFREYQKGLNDENFDKLIDEVEALNREIKNDISLGGGFCIGHSYFCSRKECTEDWLTEVINYDLLPMLSEYWYDDAEKYQKWENRLLGAIND